MFKLSAQPLVIGMCLNYLWMFCFIFAVAFVLLSKMFHRSHLFFSSFISMCGRLQGSLKFRLNESGRILATSEEEEEIKIMKESKLNSSREEAQHQSTKHTHTDSLSSVLLKQYFTFLYYTCCFYERTVYWLKDTFMGYLYAFVKTLKGD